MYTAEYYHKEDFCTGEFQLVLQMYNMNEILYILYLFYICPFDLLLDKKNKRTEIEFLIL